MMPTLSRNDEAPQRLEVHRLMIRYCSVQGGRPNTKEAKLAHAAAKPTHRALPTRFRVNHLMLLCWQEKLLSALVEVK